MKQEDSCISTIPEAASHILPSSVDEDGLFERKFEVEYLNKSLVFFQKQIGDVSCVVWDASLVLAHYLELRFVQDPNCFKNVKILELGAGVGCVGILTACFGADVTATDLQAVLPLLQYNISANSSIWSSAGGKIRACELTWGEAKADFCSPKILLVADCVYYSESVHPLVETLRQMATSDTEVLICQEQRDSDVQRSIWRQFISELRKYFKFTPIPLEKQHPLFRSSDIMLLVATLLDT